MNITQFGSKVLEQIKGGPYTPYGTTYLKVSNAIKSTLTEAGFDTNKVYIFQERQDYLVSIAGPVGSSKTFATVSIKKKATPSGWIINDVAVSANGYATIEESCNAVVNIIKQEMEENKVNIDMSIKMAELLKAAGYTQGEASHIIRFFDDNKYSVLAKVFAK